MTCPRVPAGRAFETRLGYVKGTAPVNCFRFLLPFPRQPARGPAGSSTGRAVCKVQHLPFTKPGGRVGDESPRNRTDPLRAAGPRPGSHRPRWGQRPKERAGSRAEKRPRSTAEHGPSARKWGSRLSLCQALALVLASIKWAGQLPGVAPAHQTVVSYKELKQKLPGSARHVRDPREIPRDDGDNDSDKSSHSSGAPPPGCRCRSPQLQAVTGGGAGGPRPALGSGAPWSLQERYTHLRVHSDSYTCRAPHPGPSPSAPPTCIPGGHLPQPPPPG